MSNNAYLIACDERTPSPSFDLKSRQYDVIAEGVWRVPSLWMSLFRETDLVEWTLGGDDDIEYSLCSPVVARRRIATRIRGAKDAVTRVKHVDPKCLCDLLDALQLCIDSLKPRRRYIVCEWQEIDLLNSRQHRRDMNWLMRFYSGAPVRSPVQRLEAICGHGIAKRFQNPLTTSSTDYSEHSWQVLDALVGDTLAGEAPWHPKLLQPETHPNIYSAIFSDDAVAVERMLIAGVQVEPGDVQYAAQRDNPNVLRLLLESGGDPNEHARRKYGSGVAPLVKAFNSFSKKPVKDAKVRLLLDHGADPNVTGAEPHTVLCCCFRHGMKFAEEILGKSKKSVLRRFLKFAESDEGQTYVRECGIKWKTKFLNLARKRLES